MFREVGLAIAIKGESNSASHQEKNGRLDPFFKEFKLFFIMISRADSE